MALLDFQTALGRLVRTPASADGVRLLHLEEEELSRLETLKASTGYRFTVGVQRSWCVGRAARVGHLALSILPEGTRLRLLEEWTEAGGGTSSFFGAEAEALLEFIASRLPDPSHELTACRFEQAVLRANEQVVGFTPPDPAHLTPQSIVRRGRHAGMAVFYGEPHAVIEALIKHQRPPSLSENTTTMLFGPGMERLCRVASPGEIVLWQRLTTPAPFASLVSDGHSRNDIVSMLRTGVFECEASDDSRSST